MPIDKYETPCKNAITLANTSHCVAFPPPNHTRRSRMQRLVLPVFLASFWTICTGAGGEYLSFRAGRYIFFIFFFRLISLLKSLRRYCRRNGMINCLIFYQQRILLLFVCFCFFLFVFFFKLNFRLFYNIDFTFLIKICEVILHLSMQFATFLVTESINVLNY